MTHFIEMGHFWYGPEHIKPSPHRGQQSEISSQREPHRKDEARKL